MNFGRAFRGRRVLVTGHTGFKGSWVCQWLLAEGAVVQGLALAPDTRPALFDLLGLERRIQHAVIDVRDAAAVAKLTSAFAPEVVLHLAAQPLVRRSYREPKETWDINVGGTANLLEAVRACASVRACVVVTSDKCYDNREHLWGYREHDPLGGRDPYSASKAAAELLAASWRSSFFADPAGCRLASARAGNVIGGGDWCEDRIVTDFIAAVSRGRALRLRRPRATRPWQHVLEPLSGYLHLAARLLASDGARYAEAWNFGPSDEAVVTVEALARALVRAWGSGEVVAEAQTEGPHEAGLLKLDCAKARAQLGWHGVWDFATTVERTVEWYRAHHDGRDVVALTDRQIAAYAADAARASLPWASTSPKAAHG